ncbi:MAG: hypothetical protein K6G56_05340, partial [Clostridiales bacterium]|nr:hypothetical protein [Clostridiales bacterium]
MEQYSNPQGSSKGLSIAALICGVLGIISFFVSVFSIKGVADSGNVTGVLVFGILGLILGLLGIILGAIGMKKAKEYGQSKGLAIAGLVTGIIG